MSGWSLHIKCGAGLQARGGGNRGSSDPALGPTAAPGTRALVVLSASLLATARPSPQLQKEQGVLSRSRRQSAQGAGRGARGRLVLLPGSSAMARDWNGARSPRRPQRTASSHPAAAPSRWARPEGWIPTWRSSLLARRGRGPSSGPAPRLLLAQGVARIGSKASLGSAPPRPRPPLIATPTGSSPPPRTSSPRWNVLPQPPRLQREAPKSRQILASRAKAKATKHLLSGDVLVAHWDAAHVPSSWWLRTRFTPVVLPFLLLQASQKYCGNGGVVR
jgi:hypothetical protein